MIQFSTSIWTFLGVIAACGIIAMLHLVASAIRNVTYMHDLKHQVYRLKVEYEARKRAMNEGASAPGGAGEFDIVPDSAAPARKKAA